MADAMSDASAGWVALKSGDSATAIGRFTNAIGSGQLSGSHLEIAYVKRGEAFLAIGDRPNAIADAQRALALAPNDTEAISLRVKALGAAPKGDIAGQAVAHNLGGLKFFYQRDFANAASEFQQAQQLDPTQPAYAQNLRIAQAQIHNDKGYAFFSHGDYANAANEYQQAQQLDPTQPVYARNLGGALAQIHNGRGNAFFSQGDFANAANEYQQAQQLDPTQPVYARNLGGAQAQIHNGRGNTFFSQGDFANAASEFQQAQQLDPTQPVYAQNLRNAQTALSQAHTFQTNTTQSQTSTACKMELAKAGMNIFVGMVALAKGGASYQQQDVDSSQCQGQ